MPLRNEFGRIAAIEPILRQSAKPEVIQSSPPSISAQARVWLTDSSARASVSASGAKADIREGPTRVIHVGLTAYRRLPLCPVNGHQSTGAAGPFCADFVAKVF